MEQLQRDLLNTVQQDFPIDKHPFAVVGERLGISEEQCITELQKLTDSGILREIRPVINWKEAGFTGILIGLAVKSEKIDEVAAIINEIPGVTHNYQREGTLNLWCTLTCDSADEKDRYLTFMSIIDGVTDVKEFASEKTYKIGLVLDV